MTTSTQFQKQAEMDESQLPGFANRWKALLFIGISLMVISLDNTILNVAIPSISRDLGASASDLQWIIDAYVLVFAALLLTMGAVRRVGAQAGAARRVGAVWHRVAGGGALQFYRDADRVSRFPGHGRGDHHARHAFHYQRDLSGP